MAPKKPKIPVRRVPVRKGERIGPVEAMIARAEDVETPVSTRVGVRTRGGCVAGGRRGRGSARLRGGGSVRVRGGGSVRTRGEASGVGGCGDVAEDGGEIASVGEDGGEASVGVVGGEVASLGEDGGGAIVCVGGANVEDASDGENAGVASDGVHGGVASDGENGGVASNGGGGDLNVGDFLDEDELIADQYHEDDEADKNGKAFGITEEGCNDLVQFFGEAAKDYQCPSDDDSGDDIWDDDRIPDPFSSDSDDDDEERARRRERRRQNEDPDEILSLGKMFNTVEDFKLAVLMYSLKTRYDVKLYRSQATRVAAKCSASECGWRIYCSYEKRKHKMKVKVYVNEHVCVRSGYSEMLKTSTIAWLFAERLRVNPKLTRHEIAREIGREHNLTVSSQQCAKAKTKVLRERKASHEDHFSRIWDYQAEVWKRNVDTTFEIETIPGPTIGSLQRFYRCYICFSAQQHAWMNTCRPIIGLDGAFLKWDIKGHLLAAVGRDGDNRIVPIAWAVVEIENDDNWDWFVRHLSESLSLGDGRTVAIISDKHKGLVNAVKNVLPNAEHRQCAKHILDNWKRDSHDKELERLFWKIARSYTEEEFAENMEVLRRQNPNAYASLQRTTPKSWSRAFFRIGSFCNDNLNNLSESFNRTIREARRKPLLDLLEEIRKQCMERTAKRWIVADRLKTRFTKRAHQEIERMVSGSQHCIRHMARNDLHEVELHGVSYRVDMNAQTCGCRKWQMVGIPCVHAASVIIGKRQKVEDWVNDYYTTRMWRETYRVGIEPVQGKPLWERLKRLPVLPPPWRNGNPGRPSNYARRRGRHETASNTTVSRSGRVMTCSNCFQDGHNKTTCRNPTVEPPPKKPRGRPRKYQQPETVQSQPSQAHGYGQWQFQGSHGQWQSQASQGHGQWQSQASQGHGQWQSQGSENGDQGLQGWAPWFQCST